MTAVQPTVHVVFWDGFLAPSASFLEYETVRFVASSTLLVLGSIRKVPPGEVSVRRVWSDQVTAILLDPSCSGSGIVSAPGRLHENQSEAEEEGGSGGADGAGGAGGTARVARLAAFQLQCLLKAMSFPQVRRCVAVSFRSSRFGRALRIFCWSRSRFREEPYRLFMIHGRNEGRYSILVILAALVEMGCGFRHPHSVRFHGRQVSG